MTERIGEHLGNYRLVRLLGSGHFAEVDLAQLETTEETHARYYLALAEQSEPELFRPQQRLWMGCLTGDAENFRTALQWSHTHQRKEQLLRLAGNLGHFWYMCGRFSEVMLWLETALREVAPDVAVSASELSMEMCPTWLLAC